MARYVGRNGLGLVKGASILRLRATSCGSWCELRGHVIVRAAGALHVGKQVKVDGRPVATLLSVGPDGSLTLGDRVYINYGVDILATTKVSIGDGVRIGPFTAIVDDDMHEVEPGRPRRRAPIVIGDNAWLARSVAVLPGVTIGRDSVIAAGSVVTRDVPAGVLVAGAPARVIRQLAHEDGWQRS